MDYSGRAAGHNIAEQLPARYGHFIHEHRVSHNVSILEALDKYVQHRDIHDQEQPDRGR
jgi:hypothetical protein